MALEEQEPKVNIAEDAGYVPLPTEGVSSKIFVHGGEIFKINTRNSLGRQRSDLETLKRILAEFDDHIPETEVRPCTYREIEYTGVVQRFIKGRELKKLGRERILRVLKENKNNNRAFVEKLLNYFFEAVDRKNLYPDPVGYPADQEFYNSVNLILEDSTGIIMLCDVGLSPHEDTLNKHGQEFYEEENVRTYVDKMRSFRNTLSQL